MNKFTNVYKENDNYYTLLKTTEQRRTFLNFLYNLGVEILAETLLGDDELTFPHLCIYKGEVSGYRQDTVDEDEVEISNDDFLALFAMPMTIEGERYECDLLGR